MLWRPCYNLEKESMEQSIELVKAFVILMCNTIFSQHFAWAQFTFKSACIIQEA